MFHTKFAIKFKLNSLFNRHTISLATPRLAAWRLTSERAARFMHASQHGERLRHFGFNQPNNTAESLKGLLEATDKIPWLKSTLLHQECWRWTSWGDVIANKKCFILWPMSLFLAHYFLQYFYPRTKYEVDHPIHFMFGSKVGFSRSVDQMALLPVGPNPVSRLV